MSVFCCLLNQLLNLRYNLDVCSLLKHVSSLVPLSQEHLVVKLCQLVHHLLNQLKVILDESSLGGLMHYTVSALKVCGSWTHTDVLLALSTIVYGNGPHCVQILSNLLSEDGVLLSYSAPCQPDMELQQAALNCMANLCFRVSGQPAVDDQYRSVCFRVFLQTLQSAQPVGANEILYCLVIQSALKGLQYCFLGGKWKFGGEEELGTLLASVKRLMFQGLPAVSVEWPLVLYPALLPQYDAVATPNPLETPKPPEPSKDSTASGKNKKKKSKGKGKKSKPENSNNVDVEDEGKETAAIPQKDGGQEWRKRDGDVSIKPSPLVLCPSWKRYTSDSEFSDPEGNAQSKLRLNHGRVRQGALHCLLAVVKAVEKRMLYGYWSSFIPDAPIGGPPPLTLLTIVLKDPSAKVRLSALQVLSGILDGSRQFLALAEDTASPRTSYTSFSFTLAASVRELHRALSLAVLAETSVQTLTQVIKCLAFLVSNAPYHRLRPGLLTKLWKHLHPYVHHRDGTVRVSVLNLYGAMVTTRAPLPEVQLLLQQPEGSGGSGTASFTPQSSTVSWRQREGASSPSHTPVPHSPLAPHTPVEGTCGPPWLLQLCSSLVTQPREEQAVRLAALQVLCHLVRGYFPLIQVCLCEIRQVSAHCLSDADPSVQLHGSKLLEEFGTGTIQQYRAENKVPESSRVPISEVVHFWSDVLKGPLNAALQSEQHHKLQASACDTLSSILPQAFAQLPDKTQLMCITVLLGLTYADDCLVKSAAIRALGIYVLFPCLREDVMLVADTANAILAALENRSTNVRTKAAWSLGNLTDTLIANMESVGVDFQEELSDMLLLKMLQAANKATADKDRVTLNAVRALGNLLHFLRESQMSRSAFERPVEDAVRALVKTIQTDATMKVRWNACYALGNAFRNPALPLGKYSTAWSRDVFLALCHVVTSCTNFKVRIQSAAALAVPSRRGCYGDVEQMSTVWRSLAKALENSEDTNDFLEYRYSANLRHTLSQALLHLLSVSEFRDLPALAASLGGEEGMAIREHLIKYLQAEENRGGQEEEEGEGEARREKYMFDCDTTCSKIPKFLAFCIWSCFELHLLSWIKTLMLMIMLTEEIFHNSVF
uniref:HEAT repeat-containing protein 6 n=1 Tax=Gouania willdenowi TaxID=441366 RepID=A0A8C5DAR6_GOUWI